MRSGSIGYVYEKCKYHVLVNGDMIGLQNRGRSLRQGDPFSYTFSSFVQKLFILLKRMEVCGNIHSVKVCRGAPFLTHLLFANDCFLFCRVEEREARKLLEALKTYEEASDQAISLQKFEFFFSKSTEVGIREVVKSIIQVAENIGFGKYLGLPSLSRRGRKKCSTSSETAYGTYFRVGLENTFQKQV